MSLVTLRITKTKLCHSVIKQTTPNSRNYCVETFTFSTQLIQQQHHVVIAIYCLEEYVFLPFTFFGK